MKPTVIDTLRYADRLKAAGVEPAQAEAMSRALNAELTEELVTKTDLDASTVALKTELGTEIRELARKVDAGFAAVDKRFAAVDKRFAAMDGKFAATDGKFAAMDGKFAAMDGKFAAMDGKFAAMRAELVAMDAKFDGLSTQVATQGRYVFLVLAVIASLGLYNAVAPLVAGKASQQAGSSQPAAAKIEGNTAPAPTGH